MRANHVFAIICATVLISGIQSEKICPKGMALAANGECMRGSYSGPVDDADDQPVCPDGMVLGANNECMKGSYAPLEVKDRNRRATADTCDPDTHMECTASNSSTICAGLCNDETECAGKEDENDCEFLATDCGCAVAPKDRIACNLNLKGLTNGQKRPLCLANNCCWDYKRRRNKPRCYTRVHEEVVNIEPPACSVIENKSRTNCGWSGISSHHCRCQNDCCFDPKPKRGDIWCYKKPPAPSTVATTTEAPTTTEQTEPPGTTVCQSYGISGASQIINLHMINGNYAITEETCPGPNGPVAIYINQDTADQFYFYYHYNEVDGSRSLWGVGPMKCSSGAAARLFNASVRPENDVQDQWQEWTGVEYTARGDSSITAVCND